MATKAETRAQVVAGHKAAVKSIITREVSIPEFWFWTVGERKKALSMFLHENVPE